MNAVRMDSHYDSNSKPQGYLGQVLSNYLWTALSTCTQQNWVNIVDFGAATGLNSCRTFKPQLERFRGVCETPVMVCHTDLQENLWGTLFTNVNSSPESYSTIPNVYTCAVGKSFYSQLFPANTVDIAYACAAFHWLSRPCKSDLHNPSLMYSSEVNPHLLSQHASDLTTLLRLRHTELKSGGHLIFNMSNRAISSRSMFHPVLEVAVEMMKEGLIPDGYVDNFPIPFASDTAEAHLALIQSMGTEYEVVNVRVGVEDFPLYKQFAANGDVGEYAKAFAGFTRGYLNPYLKGICSKGETGTRLIDLFFTRIEEYMRSKPEPIRMTHSYFHLKKL